jgi:tetratricopeptide (TPR) repeat protein
MQFQQYVQVFFLVVSVAGKVAAQAPNAAELMKRGIARAEQGDLTGAIADYTRAIQLNAQLKVKGCEPATLSAAAGSAATGTVAISDEFTARVFNNRGIAYYHLGDWQRALADFDRAIRDAPRLPDLYNNRGNVWLAQENWEKALADFERVIKLAPRHSQAFNNRANLHQAKGELAEALADYNCAIEFNPANALALANRGLTLLELGRNQEAALDFERAIKLNRSLKPQLEKLIERESKSQPRLSQPSSAK